MCIRDRSSLYIHILQYINTHSPLIALTNCTISIHTVISLHLLTAYYINTHSPLITPTYCTLSIHTVFWVHAQNVLYKYNTHSPLISNVQYTAILKHWSPLMFSGYIEKMHEISNKCSSLLLDIIETNCVYNNNECWAHYHSIVKFVGWGPRRGVTLVI